MNVLAVFATVLIAVASAQRDPTTICLPDKFQSDVYDFETNDPGIIVLDFAGQAIATNFRNTGRTVYNMSDFTGFVVSPDGTCTESKAASYLPALLQKCLPANARLLSNDTTFLGIPGSGGLQIEAWEIPLSTIGQARLAFTTGTPPIPIVRELILNDGTTQIIDVLMFTNQQLKIDDPSIFVKPAVCNPGNTVVG